MGMLLAFLPFLAFVIAEQFFGTAAGLISASAISATILIRSRQYRILEVGTTMLFSALAACAAVVTNAEWSVALVRLCVDAGLLVIVLASLALRQPFTLQYAREQVSAEVARSGAFLRLNDIITCAWAVAFAVLVFAELACVLQPYWPVWPAVAVSAVALVGAGWFTTWFPARYVRAVRIAHARGQSFSV